MTKKTLFAMVLFVVAVLSSAATGTFSNDKAQQLLDKKAPVLEEAVKQAAEEQAQGESKQVDATANGQFASLASGVKFTAGEVAAKAPARKSAPSRAATLAASYAEFGQSLRYNTTRFNGMISVVQFATDSAYVYHLFGTTDTLKAVINLDAGTFNIIPAKLVTNSSGEVWACSINTTNGTYSTTTPIKGTIDSDGNITIGAWGVFLTTGSNAGGVYDYYSSTTFRPSNVTASGVIYHDNDSTAKDSVITWTAYMEQSNDNTVVIYNISSDGGNAISIDLNYDKTVAITPQTLFTNSLYGDFMTYVARFSSSGVSGYPAGGDIVGTATDTSISLGRWGVFCRLSTTLRQRAFHSTTFTFAQGTIDFPTTPVTDWSGEGTETSPYIISKATQFTALANNVKSGTDYAGKYFALGNDIDLSDLTVTYAPVGTATAPFQGSFDGAGYTVKNLSLTRGERDNTGLFGYAGANSTLKNINISGFAIVAYGENTGSLVGYSAGAIKNVKVASSSVRGWNEIAGGVVGYYDGTELDGAEFSGTIYGYGSTGGVVGTTHGYATNLVNHGNVYCTGIINTASKGVGGVVGNVWNKVNVTTGLTNSYNDGLVRSTVSVAYTGGVTGMVADSKLSNCFNTGLVYSVVTNPTSSSTSTGASGGVAGLFYGANVENVLNANTVYNSTNADRIGGIVGYVMTPIKSTSAGNVTYRYTTKVKNSLNTGEVTLSVIASNQALYGATYNDTVFSNCYVDAQINNSITADSANVLQKSTKDLISGTALTGFDTNVWTFTEGQYPYLTSFANTAAAKLASVPLVLADGDYSHQVKKSFTGSSVNNTTWRVYNDETFTTESEGLSMDGNTFNLKNVSSTEVVVGYTGTDQSLFKMYRLNTVNPQVFEGSGTKDDPYKIKTKADLISLHEFVDNDHQTFEDNYFVQTNDIDMSVDSLEFFGIGQAGSASVNFNGNYDGGGYTIKNLNIARYATDENGKVLSTAIYAGTGVFGVVGAKGYIHDLSTTGSVVGFSQVGGVIGVLYGKAENLRNYAVVKGFNSQVAGVVGHIEEGSSVVGCYNAGTVSVGNTYGGGIVGYGYGDVLNNQNDGSVIGEVLNSYHAAENQSTVGGVVGYIGGGNLKSNVNTGSIKSYKNVGGIYADNGTSKNVEISGNVNYGVVNYTYTDGSRGAIGGTAKSTSNMTVANNYYDVQIAPYGSNASAKIATAKAALTRELTAGTALEGLDAEVFDFTAGLYPVLKAFKAEAAAAAARKAVITFADSDNSEDIATGAATITTSDEVKWAMKNTTNDFVIDGTSFKVSVQTGEVSDTLVATYAETFTKEIPVRAFVADFDGAGTKDDPFQIKNMNDMLKLATYVNDNGFAFSNRYFKVLNDIEFDTTAYHTVGQLGTSFDADFDGNGKKFININNVAPTTTTTSENLGLFGTVGMNGRIHDLILQSGTILGYRYTGGIVGKLYGVVENCENHANVTATNSGGAAGIVGNVMTGAKVINCRNYSDSIVPAKTYSYIAGIAYLNSEGALIENCQNYGKIQVAKSYVAGVVYSNYGVIKNCQNYGTISATGVIGGIAAYSRGGDSIINCVNYADITGTGASVGGIMAYGTAATAAKPMAVIDSCANYGTIVGSSYAGGIVGRGAAGLTIANSTNYGEVAGTSAGYNAGIAGNFGASATYPSYMKNCINYANITSAKGTYNGGCYGNTSAGAVFENSFNYGTVTAGGNFTGGFGGSMSGSATNCANFGDVTAPGYGVGGFTGIGSGSSTGCVNVGNVVSTNTSTTQVNGNAGGLQGYGQSKIADSYNMGNVTANYYGGGLFAGAFNGLAISSTYTTGKVTVEDAATRGQVLVKVSSQVPTFSNVYYEEGVNAFDKSAAEDTLVSGLSHRALTQTKLSDAYTLKEGMYPTLTAFADNEALNYFAATVVLAEGETEDHVKSAFVVGTPEGTEWTVSDNLRLENGKVTPTATGDATLTKKYTLTVPTVETEKPLVFSWSRTYNIHVDEVTAVTDVKVDATVVASDYYTVAGVALGTQQPTQPGVYVVVETYNNGAKASRKIVVK